MGVEGAVFQPIIVGCEGVCKSVMMIGNDETRAKSYNQQLSFPVRILLKGASGVGAEGRRRWTKEMMEIKRSFSAMQGAVGARAGVMGQLPSEG